LRHEVFFQLNDVFRKDVVVFFQDGVLALGLAVLFPEGLERIGLHGPTRALNHDHVLSATAVTDWATKPTHPR
jgi:hypothetical protein